MKKILNILLILIGCTHLLQAEEVVADSAMNYITLGAAQDTLIYYPAGTFGAIPEAYVKTDLSAADSTLLSAKITFTDCQLSYTWIPCDCGITVAEPFTIALRVNENGASYEIRYATNDPQNIPANTGMPQARKLLRNGQVIIIRNGAEYTLMGQKR